MRGGAVERGLRDEADYLARYDFDAERLGLAAHGLERVVQVRHVVAREVHRDLHDAARLKLEAERLQMQQPAVAPAHAPRYLLRDRQVARVQSHVVGDEQRPHAHDASARGRVYAWLAHVGRALGARRNLFLQQLEAPAPNVREVPSLGDSRGALVEVDGDAQLLPNPPPRLARERDALLDA